MTKTISYAALSATSPLEPFYFDKRSLRKQDVLIDILFCGICHSDVHMVRNEWKNSIYPMVPGHEIIGRVSKVGTDVTAFTEGDIVGVGCIIGSCQNCSSCHSRLEQYCDKGFIFVFNTLDPQTGSMNYGGFSKQIIVEERCVLRIPRQFEEQDLPAVAPLLCAGITTYSPLKNWQVGKESKVGIVGLGGLGHMAVKLAHALGAHVTVFTTSPEKVIASQRLGADEAVLSTQIDEMSKHANSFDFILNTIAFPHDLNHYLMLLKRDGTMCLVGLPSQPYANLRADLFINKRRKIAGSLIGSIKETQEMLDFCAKHKILANIELIPVHRINESFERIITNNVKYRFVVDISSFNYTQST